jgi:hemoglobin
MNITIPLYERMGGQATVQQIVAAFYRRVVEHPLLAPLFPVDMTLVMEKQTKFLSQFLGGPSFYTNDYGHPRMRARHQHFSITKERADAWLECMNSALVEVLLDDEIREILMERLSNTAYFFINE